MGSALYVLQVACTPCAWVYRLCSRVLGKPRLVAESLPEVPAETSFATIQWHGPDTSQLSSTDYFQKQVEGRGSQRRRDDLVIWERDEVARLQLDPSDWSRVDRQGLRVEYARVLGCTAHSY